MKMNIYPVKIDIEDNKRFADVAFLIDNEKFIDHSSELKEIFRLPLNSQNYQKWFNRQKITELTNDDMELFRKWFSRISTDSNESSKSGEKVKNLFNWLVKRHIKEKGRFTVADAIHDATITLCNHFKKEFVFVKVIEAVIFRNEVTEDDYKTEFLALYAPGINKDNIQTLSLEEQKLFKLPESLSFALYFDLNSDKAEIIDILNEQLDQFRDKFKNRLHVWGWSSSKRDIDHIKKHREWYWIWKKESLNGRGAYNRIVEEWNKNCSEKDYIDDVNIIEQAVGRYRKILKD